MLQPQLLHSKFSPTLQIDFGIFVFFPYPSPQFCCHREVNDFAYSILISCNQIYSLDFFYMVRLNTEIPDDFNIILMFYNTFQFNLMAHIFYFKIRLFEQLSMKDLTQIVKFPVILFLCKFATPTKNMISALICFVTSST